MLFLSPQSLIFIATQPIDFRKGIDGLVAVCKQKLNQDPLKGAIFLFYNKPRVSLKILAFDGQGFWLLTKRLSKGRFTLKLSPSTQAPCQKICYRSLYTLIHNGDPVAAQFSKNWRSLPDSPSL